MSPQTSYIDAIRGFSRFYTRRIGLLHEGLLGSSLSLTEGRVVYELGSRTTATAAELAGELDLDQGYLSRILRSFDDRDLIRRQPSTVDGRQMILSLTESGQALFTAIDATSRQEIGALLERLPAIDQGRLVAALNTAETLLGGLPETKPHPPMILRSPEAGDIGWVVHRHGALYAAEYGWDWTFEALVAEVAAGFVQNFDAARERCWIAARDRTVLGSVFLVHDSDQTARLRLLYVEPTARGAGLGRALVRECLRFAAAVGYRKITLWTNDLLVAARAIYRSEGFELVSADREHHFGKDLVSETWERKL